MRRKMADTIRAWRASRGEECLLIKGARQVRKTYIAREVGREDYESFIEVNFIEQPAAHQAFESDPTRHQERLTREIADVGPHEKPGDPGVRCRHADGAEAKGPKRPPSPSR